MSSDTDHDVLSRLLTRFGEADQAPEWLAKLRARAIDSYHDQGLPNTKHEDWRYTSLRRLLEQDFQLAEPVTALLADDLDEVMLDDLDAWRLVFVNGHFHPELSRLDGLADGVKLDGLSRMVAATGCGIDARLGALSDVGRNAFVALNTAQLADGACIMLPGGQTAAKPIELLHVSVGMDEPRVAQPRHLIMLGPNAQATVIERFVSLNDAQGDSTYFNNAVVEIDLAEGASLVHQRVQNESLAAYHLSSLFIRQAKDSRYAGTQVAVGGTWARTDLEVAFEGEGAEAELNGLFLAGDQQLSDCHLNILHQTPHCASNSTYRGVLHGKGRGVFDGRIEVARDAQQTDAHLNNANLLLSRDAEVDTKPQLEILADDVKCSHGTTVGQIEPEKLFYLRSRGIPADEARLMLCLGFAEQVLDGFGEGALHRNVSELLARQLLLSANLVDEGV